jgi:hypothetical protein
MSNNWNLLLSKNFHTDANANLLTSKDNWNDFWILIKDYYNNQNYNIFYTHYIEKSVENLLNMGTDPSIGLSTFIDIVVNNISNNQSLDNILDSNFCIDKKSIKNIIKLFVDKKAVLDINPLFQLPLKIASKLEENTSLIKYGSSMLRTSTINKYDLLNGVKERGLLIDILSEFYDINKQTSIFKDIEPIDYNDVDEDLSNDKLTDILLSYLKYNSNYLMFFHHSEWDKDYYNLDNSNFYNSNLYNKDFYNLGFEYFIKYYLDGKYTLKYNRLVDSLKMFKFHNVVLTKKVLAPLVNTSELRNGVKEGILIDLISIYINNNIDFNIDFTTIRASNNNGVSNDFLDEFLPDFLPKPTVPVERAFTQRLRLRLRGGKTPSFTPLLPSENEINETFFKSTSNRFEKTYKGAFFSNFERIKFYSKYLLDKYPYNKSKNIEFNPLYDKKFDDINDNTYPFKSWDEMYLLSDIDNLKYITLFINIFEILNVQVYEEMLNSGLNAQLGLNTLIKFLITTPQIDEIMALDASGAKLLNIIKLFMEYGAIANIEILKVEDKLTDNMKSIVKFLINIMKLFII